jgi:hypothetical protein
MGIKPWDIAAGGLLVRGAGGRVIRGQHTQFGTEIGQPSPEIRRVYLSLSVRFCLELSTRLVTIRERPSRTFVKRVFVRVPDIGQWGIAKALARFGCTSPFHKWFPVTALSAGSIYHTRTLRSLNCECGLQHSRAFSHAPAVVSTLPGPSFPAP